LPCYREGFLQWDSTLDDAFRQGRPSYDGFGNLTDKNVTGGTAPSLHVTVDSATNHLTGYTYDLNGNLTNIPSQVGLAYDAENLVKTTTPAGGGAEQYANGPPISASGN